MKKILLASLTVTTIVLLLYFVGTPTEKVAAEAFTGQMSNVATTSIAAVGTTPSLIFASSTCNARIITTTASPIMLTFTDLRGYVPTGVFGHLQAASTTVTYDSGIFGCKAYRAYSFVSGSITVTETQ